MINNTPTIFVSSTCFDLKQVREDLKEFIESNYGFNAMLSEFDSFPIDPCIGTYENCINNVDQQADIFILIIGTRYGSITDQGKSITNLEYLHAKAKGIPIYVFVSKQLYNTFQVWKSNKNGDYSSIVDSSKIFELVSEIYDSSKQWVYNFETVRDIKTTLKNQFAILFSDGLKYNKLMSSPTFSVLNSDLSPEAVRMLVEHPYAWEYKFLAAVLKNEFEKLKESKWNFKYGFFEDNTTSKEPYALLDDISEKTEGILKLIDRLDVIINTALKDALGEQGEPSDLEMIVYTSKHLASLYQKLANWGLYFKSLHTDDAFSHLLQLMYELPISSMKSIDEFVNRLYKEVMNIPDIDDGNEQVISVTCKLDEANTEDINAELNRLSKMFSDKNN